MKYSLELFCIYFLKTFTVRIILSGCVMFSCQSVSAQLADNFSDGDFTQNPPWHGITSKFTISEERLRLQAEPVDGTAFLAAASEGILNTSWEFFVRMDFNPSSTNYTRVYLASDNPELSASLNGYFVMVGNTTDEVSLYRQTGSVRTEIIDGADGVLNLSACVLNLKVTRNQAGVWELYTDIGALGAFTLEGTVVDETHVTSAHFGFFCSYSATRSDKFYFDNISVITSPMEDRDPPRLEELSAINSHELQLRFSERIDHSLSLSDFVVSNSIGQPAKAELTNDDQTLQLTFANSFPNGVACSLTATGIKDLAGNEMPVAEKTFVFLSTLPAVEKSVILTEIFPDPSPPQELPEAEYVEVFNRSAHPFRLLNWTLTDGSSKAFLPDVILLSGQYAIITSATNAAAFNRYGNVIGVSNFPSLNNTGDVIILKDDTELTVDSIKYSDQWYRSSDKKYGGWSIELIDPEHLCGESENWTASEEEEGGTPGRQNSVLASKPDLTGPKMVSVFPISHWEILLTMNENLEKATLSSANIEITPGIPVLSVNFHEGSLSDLRIVLASEMNFKTEYTISINNARDCSGNRIHKDFNSAKFGLTEEADSLDVLINEVLFNPRPNGVDFVEIVNASEKFLDLKDWIIANVVDHTVKNSKALTGEHFLLRPGDFLVLTKEKDIVKSEYVSGREDRFLQITIPPLNDDAGSVVILDGDGGVIDLLHYTREMHSLFLQDDEGVSLERVMLGAATEDASNWKSCSATVGFATPGYKNSNSAGKQAFDEQVKVEPEAFIPINGVPDFTRIHYAFEKGGYIANVRIYDARGHMIRQLATNEMLGTEGFLRWDGDHDNGTKARVGYYLIAFEIFDAEGNVHRIRKRVAIAGRKS